VLTISNSRGGVWLARRIVLWVSATLICIAAKATAQPASIDESGNKIPIAAVRLDGRSLFQVRGVSAFPAEERAKVIASNVRAVARDRAFSEQNLRLVETPYSTEIVAGDFVIVSLFDADAQPERVHRETLAIANLHRIQQAIQDYRRERQTNVLIHGAGLALASIAGLILFWFLGLKLLRVALHFMERRYRHRVHHVGIQSLRLLPAERMWGSLIAVLKAAAAAAGLMTTYVILDYVLSLFPWTREISNNLAGFVLNPLRLITSKFVDAIPNLIFLVVLGIIVYYLLKFIRIVFSSIENETVTIRDFDPMWARPTYRLVRGFVIAFALVVAFPYIPGSETQAFKGVSLFIGLVFSLGSTSLVGNLVSGYSLTYRRAFKPGDRVKIGEHVGDVLESRLLATYLRTIKNEIIAVPNSAIVSAAVINYSSLARTEKLILHTDVGIGYETPWRQVEAMLLEAAARTPGLLREPKPFVYEKELRSFDVDYEINVYCESPNSMSSLYAALHRNILDLFNEYGVQIMTPAYESDPADAKVVARDQWYAAPAVPESAGKEPNGMI
jgi:small-conductance mechanosensitive channel